MIYPVYSIKDELVGFGQPLLADNDAVARRYLEVAYNAKDSVYAVRPQDYTLYLIGQFDTETGDLVHLDNKYVCSCSDFRKE